MNMLKKSLLLTAALLPSLLLRADDQGADAAGQTGDEAPVKQTEKNTKRQITFKISDEKFPMRLPDADRKLFEQRYVASVVLVSPPQSFSFMPGSRESRGLKMLHGHYPRRPPQVTGLEWDLIFLHQAFRTRSCLAGDVLARLEKSTPLELLPSKDVLTYFHHERDRTVRLSMSLQRDESGRTKTVTFRIVAPNAERVKQLAIGLLSLVDHGFSSHARQFYQDQRKPIVDRLASYEEQLTALRAELGEVQQELEGTEEISAVALSELKTQQWQLAVDRAGAEARIKACVKMMDQKNVSPPVVERVFTIKIGAEIELSGLNAKKQMLEQIIAKGAERAALKRKIMLLRSSRTPIDSRSQRARGPVPKPGSGGIAGIEHIRDLCRRQIEGLDALIALYAPFPLQDGTIVIQPIKWEISGK
jgi:hypothetical protein